MLCAGEGIKNMDIPYHVAEPHGILYPRRWPSKVYRWLLSLLHCLVSVQIIMVRPCSVLERVEEKGNMFLWPAQQLMQNIFVDRFRPMPFTQGCGSALISSGSGSSILGNTDCYFCGSFLPPGSGSGFRIPIRIRIHRPDWIQIQYGSGSATLLLPLLILC